MYIERLVMTLKKRVVDFLKKVSIKDIFILSSGMIIAQLIGILAQPIATRLYSPDDFGVFNLILSLVSMFMPITILQYDYCIVSAVDDTEANEVTALSFTILCIFTVLFSIGIIGYNLIFPATFSLAGYWIYFSIFFIFASGIVSIIENYNNRFGQFKLMSVMSVYRASVSNIAKIVLGFAHIGFVGLIVSNVLATTLGIKRQAQYIIKKRKEIFSTSLISMKNVAIKYKNQPLFSAPGLFIVGYAYSVIPFYINSLYGTAQVGYYALATSMLGLPLNLVASSVGKVFFRNASLEVAETGRFTKSFNNTVILLLVLSVVPFVILYFTAEPIFSYVFGSEWIVTGAYVKLLIPLYFTRFIANTIIVSLIICGSQKAKLIIQSSFLLVSFLVFAIVQYYNLSINYFLIMSSLGYAINYLIMILFIFKKSKDIKMKHAMK